MAVSDPGVALRRFDFTAGALRGTHLTLYPSSLVHRGESHLETLPLAAIASARVGFERDARRLGWGGALIVIALVLLALSAPLSTFASGAAAEMAAAGAHGVAKGLLAFFRFLEAVASLLPALGIACAVGGAALCALGWIGETALVLTLPGAERVFRARGRDPRLLDFSEALSERMMALPR
jgi:hypothetical protein